MKRKIVGILTLCLIAFGLSFYVGKNMLYQDVDAALDNQKNLEKKSLETNSLGNNTFSSNKTSDDTKVDNSTTSDEKDESNSSQQSIETSTSKDSNSNESSQSEQNKNSTNTNNSSAKENNPNQNSNTNNNTKQNVEDTTNKPQEKDEKKIVNTEKNVTELEYKYEKYGSKFYNVNYYNIYTYNDGTKEKEFLFTLYTKMDSSTYNGTVSSMITEAKEIVDKNMNEYKVLLDIVNGYRKELNREPLELDYNLTVVATIRAMEMAYYNNVSHDRPQNGGTYINILDELKISSSFASGENIAAGQPNATSVANDWRNSSGHYANMVNPSYKKIGLGMYKLEGSSYGIYWAQVFTA